MAAPRLVLAVALLSACAARLSAQPIRTSALTGRVADPTGGILRGAEVSVASPDLLGGRRTISTDAEGTYRLNGLPPGTYDLTAAMSGFAPQSRAAVRLPSETTLTIDFELQLASVSQRVSVIDRAPLVDVKTSSAAMKLDDDLLQNLPTSRVLADVINLAPGVSANVGMGGVQASNVFHVDGVDVSDTQQLGAWSAFNYNWVREVQVVSVGAPAEYDGFSGVVSSAILRSGSNRFSGLAEYWTTRPGWVGRNTSSLSQEFQRQFAPRRALSWWDSSVQLGGPIVRDRLWFFSGVQYFKNEYRPFGYEGEGATLERDRRALLKLTAAPSASTRVEGFIEHDRYDLEGGDLNAFTLLEASDSGRRPDTNWNVHFTWSINGRTQLEVRNAGFSGTLTFGPRPPATRSGPFPHFDQATGISSVNTCCYFDFGRRRNVLSSILTHYADGWWGRHHEMKFGVEIERARASAAAGYPGDRFYIDDAGQPYLVFIKEPYSAAAEPRRLSIFAQDRWELNGRLTLEPGVRVNVNRGRIRGDTFFRTSPVSPRLGIAWDVLSDHTTVIRVHYGRYHEALMSAQFSFMDPVTAPATVIAEVVRPGEFVEISRSTPVNNWRMDPDLEHAYLDQWSIGIERELFAELSVQARFVRRSFKDLMGASDVGSVFRPVERRDPGPDGRVGTADDGELVTVFAKANPGGEIFFFTNPAGVFRRYDGLQLIAHKRYSRNWQLLASYTWSNSRGNVDSTPRANSGGPELGFNGVSADPNRAINAEGPTWFDFTHEFKAMGTYNVPVWGGVRLSAVYRYHTGAAWARLVPFSGDGIPMNVFGVRVEPRGSRRLPAIRRLDLRLDKTIPVRAAGGTLSLFADCFNVGNQGVVDSDRFPSVILRSGPTFGQPRFWTDPRTLRAGIRYMF
jgi:outer membrane receptor protein involved in Fe transport